MRELIPDAAQRGQSSTISGASTRRSLRWLAYAGLGGVGSLVVAVLLLHWLQPDLAPLDEAMSYYVHGAHGWLLTAGLLGLGLGSLALTAGLATTAAGPGSRIGRWFLAVWSVGVLLAGSRLRRSACGRPLPGVEFPARSAMASLRWRLAGARPGRRGQPPRVHGLPGAGFRFARTADTARDHAADSPRGLRRLARRCRDRTPAGVASESRRTR